MSALKRCLLLLVVFALPLQGALAASRLCFALMHAPAAVQSDHQHHHAQADGDHSHHGQHHGGNDGHAAGSCSLCAACCLTVAVAPDAPQLAAPHAAYTGHRRLAVPVARHVADGLERPPRTM